MSTNFLPETPPLVEFDEVDEELLPQAATRRRLAANAPDPAANLRFLTGSS
jgi:hypothetical protein